ncbi:MAG: hydroxymethylbilane synthase [Deltaproteobacteria bacterium]|nr:hydroxymethylbilane synthase [Deltaproteobacteria bacterium]
MKRIRIGSRGSMLALAQSNWVKGQLEAHYPEAQVELTIIKTSGDQFIDRPIAAIGGKGVFTKEIEDALLRNDIDIAVHSMKDLPTELPHGLAIVAVPRREDARDVVVSRDGRLLKDLPAGARVATGSLRRSSQLLHHRGDLAVVPIRGNVDTRLRKLDEGEADGLIMAAAGLIRIGRPERITEYLNDEVCLSAVAQGALGIEARDDGAMAELLVFIHDAKTNAEVRAERMLLARLGGGCHVPIGARARVHGDGLKMIAIVADPNGKALCRGEISGKTSDAVELGRHLAEQLIDAGADKILGLT